MTSATVEIQKRQRDWGYTITVKYPDWPKPVITGGGESTLKSALWHTVLHCLDGDLEIESVTVKGKAMPLAEVCERVEQALHGSVLNYRLEGVRKALL